jgi:hypothetical protein
LTKEIENLASWDQDKGLLSNDKLRRFHDFLENLEYTTFFCWIEGESNNLSTSYARAPRFLGGNIKAEDYQVVYYCKISGNRPITMDNVKTHIVTGMIDRDPMNDLLAKMNTEFCPKLLGESDWPDGVKKDFSHNLHKFMCSLTEACHKRIGRT